MAVFVCKKCSARNDSSGRCILCNASLGQLDKAFLAAAVSTAALSLIWIASTFLTFQFILLAFLYGGFISGMVTQYSGGRGLAYQLIATTYTVFGIVASVSLIIWLHWPELAHHYGFAPERPSF